jgi:hypothetical protein
MWDTLLENNQLPQYLVELIDKECSQKQFDVKSNGKYYVFPAERTESKLNYYQQAYNEDLTLKANSNIRIIHFDFVEEVDLTIYE